MRFYVKIFSREKYYFVLEEVLGYGASPRHELKQHPVLTFIACSKGMTEAIVSLNAGLLVPSARLVLGHQMRHGASAFIVGRK